MKAIDSLLDDACKKETTYYYLDGKRLRREIWRIKSYFCLDIDEGKTIESVLEDFILSNAKKIEEERKDKSK